MARKQLIIIPGLGDRSWLYRFVKSFWSALGFDTRIFVFGWNDDSVTFDDALQKLVAYIDSMPAGERYIIGASAGGTAAINALALRPHDIAKVATVCTPYAPVFHLANKLLSQSIKRAEANLEQMDIEVREKILAVHGLYDQVVPMAVSKPDAIARKRVWSAGHGLTISLALTVCSQPIVRFFMGR